MLTAYVAGPYTGKSVWQQWKNILTASNAGEELIKLGIYPFIPHRNTGWFDNLQNREFWIEGGMKFMMACDLLVLCDKWRESEGTMLEVNKWLKARSNWHSIFVWPDHKQKIIEFIERRTDENSDN